MKKYIVLYLATAAVLFPLDMLWLGVIARDFYRSRLGDLLASPPNYAIAVAFYAVYLVGVVIFAGGPALAAGGWRAALVHGALFGFFAYATYDLTNLATLRNWPVAVAVVDIVWGTVLTGVSATLGVIIARLVLRPE